MKPGISVLVALGSALTLMIATPTPAHADGKAWAAIQAKLPASVFVVAGVNMGKVRPSKVYKTGLPAILAEDNEGTVVMTAIKTTCKIDVLGAIDDAVVAMADDDNGVLVIGTKGVDEAAFDACVTKIIKDKENKTVTVAKSGAVAEYTVSGEKDKLYIAWLAADVIAVAARPTDKAMLATFTGGKGAGTALAAALAKSGTSDAAWAAMAKATPVPNAGTLEAAYGSIALTGGKIAVNGHLVMSSATDATTVASMGKQELTDVMTRIPAAMKKIARSIAIATSGAEVVITASMPDTSVPDLMKLFDKLF